MEFKEPHGGIIIFHFAAAGMGRQLYHLIQGYVQLVEQKV
jgi:hypothetical protein